MGYDIAAAVIGVAFAIAFVRANFHRYTAIVRTGNDYRMRRTLVDGGMTSMIEASGPNPEVVRAMCERSSPARRNEDQSSED